MHLFVFGILSQDDYLWTFQLEQAASPKTPPSRDPRGESDSWCRLFPVTSEGEPNLGLCLSSGSAHERQDEDQRHPSIPQLECHSIAFDSCQ